jgi:hypothetical protein
MLLTNIYITFIVNKRSKERIGSYSPELERNMTLLKEEVKPLRYYPLVFMAANVFPLINRIQNAAAGGSRDDPSFPISLLAILSVPMQGYLSPFPTTTLITIKQKNPQTFQVSSMPLSTELTRKPAANYTSYKSRWLYNKEGRGC